jgi:hypothetical protein
MGLPARRVLTVRLGLRDCLVPMAHRVNLGRQALEVRRDPLVRKALQGHKETLVRMPRWNRSMNPAAFPSWGWPDRSLTRGETVAATLRSPSCKVFPRKALPVQRVRQDLQVSGERQAPMDLRVRMDCQEPRVSQVCRVRPERQDRKVR